MAVEQGGWGWRLDRKGLTPGGGATPGAQVAGASGNSNGGYGSSDGCVQVPTLSQTALDDTFNSPQKQSMASLFFKDTPTASSSHQSVLSVWRSSSLSAPISLSLPPTLPCTKRTKSR